MSLTAGRQILLSSAAGAYSIDRSLRFNSADSAYLGRTPGSAGNRKTWTWSGWVKKARLGNPAYQATLSAGTSNADINYIFVGGYGTDDAFGLVHYNGSFVCNIETTAVFRDVSAWYHLLVAVDTTQATASNRVKIYVNGSQVTSFSSSTYPSQDHQFNINSTSVHHIGSIYGTRFLDAYLADIYFIDGSALTPSSFGEFDATTGVWVPKTPTGLTYGTNGFHLDFADNSSAAALGYDAAGSNDWTVNNLSVTAGAGNDSLRDSPTNGTASTGGDAGGVTVGNYCTLNPLYKAGTGTPTYTNGNLDFSAGGASGDSYFAGTFAFSSGKYYYEATINAIGSGVLIGICRESDSASLSVNRGSYRNTGIIYNLDATTQTSGATYTTGDIIGVSIDCDNGNVQFYKNGASQGSTPSFTFTAGTTLIIRGRSDDISASISFNFGQRAFAYAAPSGYKALCTANLPAPTIVKPSSVMDVKLYTGTGSTQSITGLGFSPDFVWIKRRTVASNHCLFDVVRGATKRLVTDGTDAEATVSTALTSFDSSGFTVGSDSDVNGSTYPIVSWAWDAGTSNATNTSGTITSTVRANISAGFSVQTWTASGSGTDSWGHGLGIAPEFVIVKRRNSAQDWYVWHKSLTSSQYLFLNSTSAVSSYSNIWGASGPSSSLISFAASPGTHVSYAWAPVAGYSAFGSYTGNGSSDGPFVYTGFRPRWVLIKIYNDASSWFLYDTARNTYNAVNSYLLADAADAETTSASYALDTLSNGFKLRSTAGGLNGSTLNYVYAAFAESPFNFSRAR